MHRPQLLHNMKLFHLCVQFKMLVREGQRKVWKWTWNVFSLSSLTSHCFQPPGKSSGGCYSAHYSTVHLGHMFAIHAFFILFFSMNWLNHVLSNREEVLNRNLTLDATANRCQRVLLLVWPPIDVFWKELSDLKVSLCTNMSGKKPSRWTLAIQSFKELWLGAVHIAEAWNSSRWN